MIDQLWGGEPPSAATHTVQVFVSRLRKALGTAADRLVTRGPGYVLEIDADAIDADRCERSYTDARAALAGPGDYSRAESLLRDALALWRGVPLADFTYEPFAQAAIARLDELKLNCREELIEAEDRSGTPSAVDPGVGGLRPRAAASRAGARRRLMLALYRCGRRPGARKTSEARQKLIDELGVEPGAALRELHEAILRQDPGLDGPVPRPKAPGQCKARALRARGRGLLRRLYPNPGTVIQESISGAMPRVGYARPAKSSPCCSWT